MTEAPNALSEQPECLDALPEPLRFLLHTPDNRVQRDWFSNGRTF